MDLRIHYFSDALLLHTVDYVGSSDGAAKTAAKYLEFREGPNLARITSEAGDLVAVVQPPHWAAETED
jgi:hypothetical protein